MLRHMRFPYVVLPLMLAVAAGCSSPGKPTVKDALESPDGSAGTCRNDVCDSADASDSFEEPQDGWREETLDSGEFDTAPIDLADLAGYDSRDVADSGADLLSDGHAEDVPEDLVEVMDDAVDLESEDAIEETADLAPDVEPECTLDADCVDDDLCNGAEVCLDEACVAGMALVCDDDNVCTDDSCEPAIGCVFSPNDAACDDQDACTKTDACQGGECKGSGMLLCDDLNPCTDDWCGALSGCFAVPNSAACDDQDACTVDDTCEEGTCTGTAASCDDGNPCTEDSCDALEGCLHADATGDCSDGDPCTENDECFQGQCAGDALDCDDAVDCTVDACDPGLLCVHTPDDELCLTGSCFPAMGCLDLSEPPYPLTATGQTSCYGAQKCSACPVEGTAFYGQNAQYVNAASEFVSAAPGTAIDLTTGLMWSTVPLKLNFVDAADAAATSTLAGYDDWRLPTIKELYTLIQFSGADPTACETVADCVLTPFIDTSVFDFSYGDTDANERLIDAQYISSTLSVHNVMQQQEAAFGVNLADGRIKAYPIGQAPDGEEAKLFQVLLVRGSEGYGVNQFQKLGDGLIHDATTGLVWMEDDNISLGVPSMNWESALAWCEGLEYGGFADWRLPNAKELQSIVDYTRAPQVTNSAAIDPLFVASMIKVEEDNYNWGFYWTSTTHRAVSSAGEQAGMAAYVGFGECLGFAEFLEGQTVLLDVHGAGCQRSDPKAGNPEDYAEGSGPQGDVVRINNLVRCVRLGTVTPTPEGVACPPLPGPVECGQQGEGEACCGDGTCDFEETTSNCPADCSGGSSQDECQTDADCTAQLCPPQAAKGCICNMLKEGYMGCVPKCSTAADCKSLPGPSMTCGPGGFCVPA